MIEKTGDYKSFHDERRRETYRHTCAVITAAQHPYYYEDIRYRRLNPNYQVYWTGDSDACNSIDPHDAILWFLSHGFECLSHPNGLFTFLVRNGRLIFRKKCDA